MMSDKVLDHVQIEVIGTSNPLVLSMSNHNNIIGVELEQFHWDPQNGGAQTAFLGIKAAGTRGRYNEFGYQNEILRTIPKIGNAFHWESNGDSEDSVKYINNGSDLIISFVDRNDTSINQKLIQFDNNYLLNISLLLQ